MNSAILNSDMQAAGSMAIEGVEKGFFADGQVLPIIYQATTSGVDAADWYARNVASVDQDLLAYGAVLFRGFPVAGEEQFERFAKASISELAAYTEGATPRKELKKGVYTSTEFPADQEIALHNELSYVPRPPRRLAFCCLVAPKTGGQTQIADVRNVHRRLDPALVAEFEARGGWMLRRNYGNHFGPTVFKAFGTEDMDEIRLYCERAGIRIEVHSEGVVTTQQVRPAVHPHPTTGEPIWFNHVAFWHPSSLCPSVREVLDQICSRAQYPYCTYYGDGSEIPEATVAALRAAYTAEEIAFDWQAGDILLVDNWRVAHGRKPFTGDRRIIVSMG